ncbi:citrate-binding protein-like [Gastrolobium bilobum]|uniref:citrate-binding protein-like n=1 Tax=Gastrolobium bilobum TaxID=150636 RepID=UPI002AAF4D88|nr:citrate-binding protein-like [Gastrolobium bilobum]
MGVLYHIALLSMAVYFSSIMHTSSSILPVDLTLGFTDLPLNTSNFHHDKPYNLPINQRYSFIDGVHKFWGYDYSSGVWQFEGQGFVPNGTSGECSPGSKHMGQMVPVKCDP